MKIYSDVYKNGSFLFMDELIKFNHGEVDVSVTLGELLLQSGLPVRKESIEMKTVSASELKDKTPEHWKNEYDAMTEEFLGKEMMYKQLIKGFETENAGLKLQLEEWKAEYDRLSKSISGGTGNAETIVNPLPVAEIVKSNEGTEASDAKSELEKMVNEMTKKELVAFIMSEEWNKEEEKFFTTMKVDEVRQYILKNC